VSADDPVTSFRDAMACLGIVPRQAIVPDGRLHRFDVEGDRRGSRTGFYVLHLDGRPAGVFGCWKRGLRETWNANGAPLSDFDRAKLMREIETERKRRQREEAKRHKDVAAAAAELWAGYAPAAADPAAASRAASSSSASSTIAS
jgi:putative DNA primase/helicase